MHFFYLFGITKNYKKEFLKTFKNYEHFENSPLANSANFTLKCSLYILYFKVELQHAYSADHNSSLRKTPAEGTTPPQASVSRADNKRYSNNQSTIIHP